MQKKISFLSKSAAFNTYIKKAPETHVPEAL